MKKIFLTLLSLTLITSFAYAQDSNKLLDKLVEKQVLTIDEANEIKAETEAEDKSSSKFGDAVKKVRNAFNTPYLQISGYGQFLYEYNNTKDVHNNFKAKNAFLIVNGKINDYFRYGFMFEFANPTLTEYWTEFTIAKQFNVKIGQFKVPLTLENPISASVLETIEYSRSTKALAGMGGEGDPTKLQAKGKASSGRDLGLQVSGELFQMKDCSLIQYSLGMFQGSGINTSDQNNSKDFAGTITFQPIKGFRVGGGAYFGQTKYSLAGGVEEDHVRNRWVASAEYTSSRFNSRVEYLRGNDGGIKKDGINALALYYFKPKVINALVKMDYFNSNKNINTEVFDYTIGANYFFFNQCRVQLNYTYSDYSRTYAMKDSHSVMAQLQIVF